MSTRTLVSLVLIFVVIGPLMADEAVDPTAVIESLTSQGRTTWIPAGTILASHREYRAAQVTDEAAISQEIQRQLAEYQSHPWPEVGAERQKLRIEAIPFNVRYWMSNEYTMESTVILRYDGDRYYYERQVESRSDSVQVPSELRGNYMTEDFRLEWNEHRIIAWDGQNYTTYEVPMNDAAIQSAAGAPDIAGPLTAGILPWDQGILTAENLAKADVSAVSVYRDGMTQIEMAVEQEDGSPLHFVLDPSKNYAVTSCSLPTRGNTVVQNRYFSGYQQVAGNWVPTTVLIEDRDASTDRLLGYDQWDFLAIDSAIPGPQAFTVDFGADTRVQFQSPVATATYNYSNVTDTEALLAEHLAYVSDGGPRNCATAALQDAASRLGKSVPDGVLDELVGGDGQTSLYELKQAAQGLGLQCRAVTADIATLKDLTGCVAILHLPGRNHFVVLDHIDEQYVWLIDLASPKFYYRKSVDMFPMDWPDGTALLLSNQPVSGVFTDLSDGVLTSISGAVEGWSCTYLIQEAGVIFCTAIPGGCIGYYRYFFPLYGCEPSPSGSCTEELWIRQRVWACYTNSKGTCMIDTDAYVTYYDIACGSEPDE